MQRPVARRQLVWERSWRCFTHRPMSHLSGSFPNAPTVLPRARASPMPDDAASPLGPRFDQALALTSRLHRHQLRKGSGIPYLSHLLSVSALVVESGGDEDEAIAGLLHDALEDCADQISAEALEKKFGERVRRLVEACTDTPPGFDGGEKPPWQDRKRGYMARLRSGEIPWRVSLADKLHNARSILRDHRTVGDEVWERFSASKEDTLWYYRSLVQAYRDAGAEGYMLEELERVVGGLEWRAG